MYTGSSQLSQNMKLHLLRKVLTFVVKLLLAPSSPSLVV